MCQNIKYRSQAKKNHHIGADVKVIRDTSWNLSPHCIQLLQNNVFNFVTRRSYQEWMKFSDVFDRGKLIQAKLIIKYNVIFSHLM